MEMVTATDNTLVQGQGWLQGALAHSQSQPCPLLEVPDICTDREELCPGNQEVWPGDPSHPLSVRPHKSQSLRASISASGL